MQKGDSISLFHYRVTAATDHDCLNLARDWNTEISIRLGATSEAQIVHIGNWS